MEFAKKKRGFTLIELLVVIAIIGTLAGIVLVSLGTARQRARNAVRQSDMRQVITAQEMYYGENEAYNQATNLVIGDVTSGIPAIGTYLDELHDPQCPAGTCAGGADDYGWIDNTADATKFCAYAIMEGTSPQEYFAASHKGTKTVTVVPASVDCW